MRRALIVFPLAGLIVLMSCNWGKKRIPLEPTVSITLVSSATVVTLGRSATITATVYDQSSQGAAWSISPLSFGTLSDETPTSVTYTAPTDFSTPTTITITATSITNPTITSSLQILASPLKVSLATFNGPLTPQTVNQGGQIGILAFVLNDVTSRGVTWSLSPPSGAGSLVSATPFGATYQAPTTVTGPTTVTLTAASVEDPTAIASVPFTVLPSGAGPNVVTINVDGGPVPGQLYPNAAFTSVTLCNPGSTTACQTVGGILVDTGSYGLRILQSQIPLLKLPKLVDNIGNTLQNCAAGVDGSYLWGPVSYADVYIGGEAASSVGGQTALNSVRVQVISSSNGPVPNGCSNGGAANLNTPLLLGANGILGIGPEPTDCTLSGINYCDGSVQPTPPNLYYSCPSLGCATTDSPIIVTKFQQVSNPIPLFSADRNGVILQLPLVSNPQAAVSGFMIFGIGTASNNQLGSATVFTLDSSDNFTTIYDGQTLTSSFIDSGSNALYFPSTLPPCDANSRFFCPSSPTGFSATNQGMTQGQTTVGFSVDSADNLFTTNPDDTAFSTLAGPNGTYNSCSGGGPSCTFVWGLPFFYGRSVYFAIDGQAAPFGAPNGPWWAY